MAAKNKISANRAATAVGLVFAIWQAVWGGLLAWFGSATVGYMYSMSMMSSGGAAYIGFDWLTYVGGVIVTFVLGWISGYLFAWIWNMLKD